MQWTRAIPSPLYSAATAYDSARGVTVLFGGYDGSSHLGDTWEWDGTAWTSARQYHAMAYDSTRGVTVLFGGGRGGLYFGDTWELVTSTTCPDLNGDGSVDLSDLIILLAHFGTPSGASFAGGDLNGDGAVSLSDLTALLSALGSSCP